MNMSISARQVTHAARLTVDRQCHADDGKFATRAYVLSWSHIGQAFDVEGRLRLASRAHQVKRPVLGEYSLLGV